MIDWISWVMIALLIYFFGKGEYAHGYLDNYKEFKHDKSVERHHSKQLTKDTDKYRAYFAIVFAVFLLRETMLSE